MTGRRTSRFNRLARLGLVFVLLFSFTVNTQAAGPVQVVLKVLPGVNLSLITNLLGGTIVDSIPGANTYLLNVPNLPLVTPLLRLLGLQWIEPNRSVGLSLGPGAQLEVPFGNSPDWYKGQPSLQLIRSEAALQYSTGRGRIVADINSRVDYGHPALAGHVGAGYDFVSSRPTGAADLDDDQSTTGFLDDDQSTTGFLDDDQSTTGFLDDQGIRLLDDQSTTGFLDGGAAAHGTFTAGILAVVAPDATIMPLRAFDDNGSTDLFMLAKAIRYARNNGADVINMSFGTLTNSRVIKEAIDYADAGNLILIASAGNNNTSTPQYPAAYPNVIAVAATTLLDRKASFSNFGSYIFVDAPGDNIISATPNGGYGIADGTSFSAPMVAGMAALIRERQYNGVEAEIAGAAIRIDWKNLFYWGKLGYGRIDILRAVKP